MEEKYESETIIPKGHGIMVGGNVTFGNVNGQVAIGENIIQTQSKSQINFGELRKNLIDFQNGVSKLNLSSDYQNIINGDISAAIIETKRENPAMIKIKEKFKDAINTIREAGKTIKDISELYEPAKKVASILGIVLYLKQIGFY